MAPEQPSHLGCSYETNGSPYLLLQPAKKETLRLQPYIVLYHDFVSDAEAETIKGLAGPWVSSRVGQECRPHWCPLGPSLDHSDLQSSGFGLAPSMLPLSPPRVLGTNCVPSQRGLVGW